MFCARARICLTRRRELATVADAARAGKARASFAGPGMRGRFVGELRGFFARRCAAASERRSPHSRKEERDGFRSRGRGTSWSVKMRKHFLRRKRRADLWTRCAASSKLRTCKRLSTSRVARNFQARVATYGHSSRPLKNTGLNSECRSQNSEMCHDVIVSAFCILNSAFRSRPAQKPRRRCARSSAVHVPASR